MAVETGVEPRSWTRGQRLIVGTALAAGLLARWWALGRSAPNFDETFTAAYSRLPLDALVGGLRADDSHPPLDYVLRHPLADTGSAFLLRSPSAVFSTAALVLVVAWMRRRSWLGVGVVVLFALSPFQLLYGREARMYALMALLGVGVAMLSERFVLGDGRVRLPVGVAVLVTVACLDHAGGLFLAAGVATLPGLRSDRAAWRWRAAVAAGVGVWALLWGLPFLDQVTGGAASWIPLSSPDTVATALGGLVTFLSGAAWIGAALLMAAVGCCWGVDRVLWRLVMALFVVPCGLLVLAGTHFHVLQSRTLAASSWAAPVLLASLVVWLWRRRVVLGVGAVVIVGALTIRSLPRAVTYMEDGTPAVGRGVAAVAPGDGLVVHPRWLWPMAVWSGAEGGADGADLPSALHGVDGWYWLRGGAEPTGRAWVLEPDGYHLDTGPLPSCGEPVGVGGGWTLSCVVTGVP